ncbi:MAG: ATP-binding protein [Lachnospiraceae bacterium]
MIKQFLVFSDLDKNKLLSDFSEVISEVNRNEEHAQTRETMLACYSELISFAENYGLSGNLWHVFLTFLLVDNENPYSRACEIRGRAQGSLYTLVLYDFAIMKQLFDFNIEMLSETVGAVLIDHFMQYQCTNGNKKMINGRIRDHICDLAAKLANADSVITFADAVTEFYQLFGTGSIGLHKAFRVDESNPGCTIRPITNITHVTLNDLVGYDIAKKKLVDNTQAFVDGKKANNCLLFGDAGTGKSTCIKAIVNQYYEQGLRMIEIYKHQFHQLNAVIDQIKNRNYKFIIYMDDLSFEEFETGYKYLKAVIEGGLEKKPDNVLIYATSNRRHLVREKFSDKAELSDDLHNNDTVQEKLSLAARFGVTIYFGAPEKKEFHTIVLTLARRNNILLPEEELYLLANKWELSHGGLSGRTAQQFIDYLLGRPNNG